SWGDREGARALYREALTGDEVKASLGRYLPEPPKEGPPDCDRHEEQRFESGYLWVDPQLADDRCEEALASLLEAVEARRQGLSLGRYTGDTKGLRLALCEALFDFADLALRSCREERREEALQALSSVDEQLEELSALSPEETAPARLTAHLRL